MPAKNLYHREVVAALQEDGWTITHDPYPLWMGRRDMHVDLGAERNTLAAERGPVRIAVEIQSFLGKSPVRSLQEAVGQYEIYRRVMRTHEPDRILYMAVGVEVYEGIFSEELGRFIVEDMQLHLLVFDHVQRRVVRWIE